MKKLLAFVAAASFLIAGGLMAQTIIIPKVASIGANDLFQDIVNGQPQAQNYYATAAQLGTYGLTLPGAINGNVLIGGDFSTNQFAYTTTPAAVNGTATYVANRWFIWGGGTSTLTATQQTGATDVPAGSNASLRVSRAGNGLTQVCAAQEVESVNSLPLAGQTAEFDFQVKAGATFSAVGSNLAVYVLTGTGTDEGSSKAAFSINAGGGGATGWTGATLLGGAAGFLDPITTTFTRTSIAVPIAANVTEVAVAICYTPVGNGASTDWFEFTQAQLVQNPALTPVVGTAGLLLAGNDVRAKSFQWRAPTTEIALQQRYYYAITEPSTGVGVGMTGVASSTVTCDMSLQLPVPMRATPLFRSTAVAQSTSTFRIVAGSSSSTVVAGSIVNPSFNTPSVANLRAGLTSATTAGFACQLQGNAAGLILNWDAEL